ncbi:60 kDa SS-A/Ro ribonucleoprotein [Frankliniella fusca]|uniref:60 kDa SS-A/Ro ribonucleoprotein n=1 Tax=Frankliniella fusca TaxID=407009 RepID=A0AAE1HS68_9NEOP|nr:60 kDa SS-A/Ro ribonucleoprotein [Frankliniella fusca]
MAKTTGLAPADIRLKRFLHYGSEAPLCVPRDPFFLNCFLLKNLTAVEELLANCAPDKQGDAVNHILKAFMDGYSGYPDCLIFALAVCATNKGSVQLCTQAYSAVKKICKTPKDLFLFCTFTKKLSTTSGSGGGWRKALCNWYLSKEPLDFATCVAQFRGAHSYTHRDLFKLCHIKTDDKAKGAIICYVMKGLEAAKMLPDKDDPAVQRVLSYLQIIEDVKHQTDVHSCARLVEAHNLPKEIVPQQFFKSAEIWIALVPNMTLRDLLDSIIRLSCAGLLKPGQPLEARITDRLVDQTAIVESQLHPTEVYCVIKRYENHAKNTYEMMRKFLEQGRIDKTLKPAPKPNANIISALNKLLVSTFKLLVPTGMRYLLAMDLSSNMQTWKCNGERDVKPAEAAVLLALCLLNAEREVTVATFPPVLAAPPEEELIDPVNPVVMAVNRRGKKKPGELIYPRKTELQPMVPLQLDKDLSVYDNLEKAKEPLSGPPEVCQPIVWAQQNKKPVDVFIVITDYVTLRKRAFLEPSAALQEYRQNMNLPNTKFITCALASNTLDVAAHNDLGMLDIVGFNGKVARIIEAFSRGAF